MYSFDNPLINFADFMIGAESKTRISEETILYSFFTQNEKSVETRHRDKTRQDIETRHDSLKKEKKEEKITFFLSNRSFHFISFHLF